MKRAVPQGKLYLDALGDAGRANLSQPSYATGTIWIPGKDETCEEFFSQVRRDLELPAQFEFHATQLTKEARSKELRRRFFELLENYGFVFEAWIVEVEKESTDLPLHFTGKMLTNELALQTLLRMPRPRVEGHILTIDEKVEDKKAPKVVREMGTHIKGAMREQKLGYTIGSVRARQSHQSVGLQLADFVVAAMVKPWPECQNILASWHIEYWRS